MFYLLKFLIILIVSLINKFKEGFFFSEVSVVDVVVKIDVFIFYIYGDVDVFVFINMVDEFYKVINSYKEKWIVKGVEYG